MKPRLRWQRAWEERGIFASKNDDPRSPYYVLQMFPYPSGASTWATCAITRWATSSPALRAQGVNVLHPMGWDAFGLPARTPRWSAGSPKGWTYDNIAAMKKQLQTMGLSLFLRLHLCGLRAGAPDVHELLQEIEPERCTERKGKTR